MLESFLILSGLKKRWPTVNAEDVLLHNDRDSLWIISGKSVYDITPVLGIHPGGDAALLRRAGGLRDCTNDYHFHSRYARKVWDDCKIGELASEEVAKLPRLTPASVVGYQSGKPCISSADCLEDGSPHGQSSFNSSTLTVETVPSSSVTPGHYRLRDELCTGADYHRQHGGAGTRPKIVIRQ